MLGWIKKRYLALRASMVKKERIREITKVLLIAHASELAHTPGEQWPVVKERQSREILAVQDGKIDIVDRRSWEFPYLPETLHRLKQPIIKNTPYNIRRFSRTPVPRRAINLIKTAITSLEWDIVPIKGGENDITDDQRQRIEIGKDCFMHPNGTESFLQFQEEGIDDMCVNGAFVIEPQLTPDIKRPFKMWTVDSSTIRMFADWKESAPDQPRYAQMTGLKGERGIIVFYDDELVYIKDNPQVDSPFGLGKMEVAFQAINSFLGVQEMSGRAGTDQIHKTWLWWDQSVSPSNMDLIRRHIMNDLEGQAKVSLVAGMKSPTVVDINPVVVEDLLLPWHEMLIRMIANGFDMSAMALNLERDINRSTGEVLDDRDFRSSVVPMARRLEESYTRFILHRLLGWTDLKFSYLNMDDPDAETKMVINQQEYATNSTTPNEIRVSMGKPKSASPFADLTQFECMIIMAEAQSIIAQAGMDQQMGRQTQMMQQQYGMMQDTTGAQADPKPGSKPSPTQAAADRLYAAGLHVRGLLGAGLGVEPANTGKKTKLGLKSPMLMPGLKMPSPAGPQGLHMPKMPIAGSVYSAMEIANMSVDEVKAATQQGQIPPNKQQVKQQMNVQEPGILDKLSDELKIYFGTLEDLQKEKEEHDSLEITDSLELKQKKAFRDFQHQPPEIERVYNKGVEKSPELSKLRLTNQHVNNYAAPEAAPAFARTAKKISNKKPPMTKNGGKVSKSGGAATGRGIEKTHNPPYRNLKKQER